MASPHAPKRQRPATRRAKPVRRPLPAHLPRQVRKILPKETACPDCGGELEGSGRRCLGDAGVRSGHFQVIQQVRPKLAARAATRSCRRKRRAVRLPGVWLDQGCWRMCWSRNTATTSLCTGRRRFTRGKGWSWSVPRSRTGWVGRSQLLAPLVEALRRHVMSAAKAARRRHPGAGSGARLGQDQNGTAVDLCS